VIDWEHISLFLLGVLLGGFTSALSNRWAIRHLKNSIPNITVTMHDDVRKETK
jgi:hypothetical protein